MALGLAALASLAAGELFARLAVGSPLAERTPLLRVSANPFRGWAMMPGEDHYTYRHLVRMNALGLRGAEVPEEKGAERRVLALGDSLTYGQGVADDETLPVALEAALERGGDRDWRVINSGHRGYATNQELGLLRELGPRLQPDLVLLLWFYNDLETPDIDALHARLTESGPVCFDLNAPFEGRPALAWHAKQLLRRSALVMLLYDTWRAARAEALDPAWRRGGLSRLPRQLDELKRLCAQLGARPFIVTIPEAAALRGEPPSVEITARALELAAERDLPTLDLLPAMRARYGERERPPILLFDGHYTAEANAFMGERVAEWLLSEQGPGLGR
jgi:lysophospholipase L1-like esterase